MDVKLNLINSATDLIRDRKTAREKSPGLDHSIQTVTDPTEITKVLSSKFSNLQTKIQNLQEELTKEQTRIGILNEENINSEEDLRGILFGNSPLFMDLHEIREFDKEVLLKKAKDNKDRLFEELRKNEVEQENIFSVGVLNHPEDFMEKIKSLLKDSQNPMRPISPVTVDKLVKD